MTHFPYGCFLQCLNDAIIVGQGKRYKSFLIFYKEPGWCEELVKCQQGAVYPHWVRVAKTLINLIVVDRTQTSISAYICSHSAMSVFRFYRSSFTNMTWTNLIPKAYLFHFNKSETLWVREGDTHKTWNTQSCFSFTPSRRTDISFG